MTCFVKGMNSVVLMIPNSARKAASVTSGLLTLCSVDARGLTKGRTISVAAVPKMIRKVVVCPPLGALLTVVTEAAMVALTPVFIISVVVVGRLSMLVRSVVSVTTTVLESDRTIVASVSLTLVTVKVLSLVKGSMLKLVV